MSENTQTQPAIGKLVEALIKAKAEIKPPTKNHKGKVQGISKSGKAYEYEYEYADRADVIKAYVEPLARHGLVIVHTVELVGDSLTTVLVSRLIHTSGAEIVSRLPIPAVKDAQPLGGYMTYFERYQACALLDIAAEDDDDGKRAVASSGRDKERRPAPRPEPQPDESPAYECVTDEQIESIHAAAKAAGLKTLGELKAALLRLAGTNDSKRVPADKYEHVVEQLGLMMKVSA